MATLTTSMSPVGAYDHHDDHDAWDISQDIREKSGIASDFSDSFLGIDDADRSGLSERRKPSPASTTASYDRTNNMRSPMIDDGTFGDGSSTHNPHARAQSRTSERKSRSDRPADSNSLSSSAPRVDDKWIHRDKLAKIENAELQAAGIVLPKPRAVSRRRDRSEHSYHRAEDTTSRKNSMSMSVSDKPTDIQGPAWDLRLPEEIMEEGVGSYWESPSASGKGSRIPVAKISPAPIPNDFLDRDMPMGRSKSHEPDSDPLRKPRSRSNSTRTANELSSSMSGSGGTSSSVPPPNKRGNDTSPRKVSATRKSSVPPRRSTSRPKTRSRKESSATQLSVRSGELSTSSSSKQPEGDPPWMVSAYKPDPRLPPEEQLLPTVARRLQQEKWEKEGKFGNVYDKDFRPLNEDGFIKPPGPPAVQEPEPAAEEPAPGNLDEPIKMDQWPLKTTDIPPSPTVRSYSTMPKINDQAPGSPVMPRSPGTPRSPRPEMAQQQSEEPQHMQPQISHQQDHQQQQNEQSLAQLEKDKDAGCGCCIVM